MFVTAVCILFLLKLKWPKNKGFYLHGYFCLRHLSYFDLGGHLMESVRDSKSMNDGTAGWRNGGKSPETLKDGLTERRMGGMRERRKIPWNPKTWIDGTANGRNDGTAENPLKFLKMEWRNGGKSPEILKDGMTERRSYRITERWKISEVLKDGMTERQNGVNFPQSEGMTLPFFIFLNSQDSLRWNL